MRLSIIIPCLNEVTTLPALLADLRKQQNLELQIIVADGGSSDETPRIADAAGVAVVTSPRGRGKQMNAGAQAATGEWLLFLHADSGLQEPSLLYDAVAHLKATAETCGSCIAGHFPLRFAQSDNHHDFFFRYLEGKTRLNRPYTINGDQGLLIPSNYFRELGGFDESLPFLEDQRIAAKIFASGHWCVLPGHLRTSARRFETEGIVPRYTLMALMMGLHDAGAYEFFTRAPQIYAAQSQAATLDLCPFVQLARQILRERGRLKTLYRIGGFVRDNVWQIFYYLDFKRGDARQSRLHFHDRRLAPLLAGSAGQLLITTLLGLWFYLWLPVSLWHQRK